MANTTHLDAALSYLRQGWSVFPLMPGGELDAEGKGIGKRPLTAALPNQSWATYQRRKPTEEEVRRWWTQWPTANIAIVTGRISGLVVVDVDPEHGGTADGLPPTGLVQVTRHGGTQHFYAYPADAARIPNQVDVGGSGRDVRADGGYVVAPPSVVLPDEGMDGPGRYTWKVAQPDDLGVPPDWALAPPTTDEGDPVTDKWLDGLLRNGAPAGQRNDSLIRMAGYYAKKQIPMDAALTLCHQWSDSLATPLPKDEVDVTVKSAYKMERRRQREREPVVVNDELLPMTTVDDYMVKHGDSEVKWLIKDWLPQGTIAFLVSPPQSYKTYITFDLACAVASGQPFLGEYPVNNPGMVAIFQQEDPHSNIAERTATISTARLGLDFPHVDGDTLYMPHIGMDNLPIYFHEERRLRFDDPEVMDALEAWIAANRPRVVIVDPLYAAVDTANDEYMAKAARKMMRIKDIRDKYGTTFIIVHHSNKSMETWDRQKVWGSQFINAFIETSWLMRKPSDEDSTVIKRHFKVSGGQPFIKVTFDMQTEEPPFHYRTIPATISQEEAERVVKGQSAKTMDPKPNALEKPVLKSLADGPATVEAISAVTDAPQSDVLKTLRGLLSKHRVRENFDGKWETMDVDLG